MQKKFCLQFLLKYQKNEKWSETKYLVHFCTIALALQTQGHEQCMLHITALPLVTVSKNFFGSEIALFISFLFFLCWL